MSLFQYTYNDGTTVESDEILGDNIFELIFVRNPERFKRDNIRPHMSHPLHEKAIQNLPSNLNILRAVGTKLRTWPTLPQTIHECYLSGNHYMQIPDLAQFNNLIVLELDDNSIEAVENPLPPTLARLNLDLNALRRFNKQLVPPSCASVSTFSNPVDFYTKPIVRRPNPWEQAPPEEEEEKPKNIYVNDHNVHDSGVQKSTKQNILYLVDYKPTVVRKKDLWSAINAAYKTSWFQWNTSDLPGTILQEYAKTPYIMHGVEFVHLVDRIWLRIQDTEDKETKKELQKRFQEEVQEGRSHCLNGMMVRLVNVFLGFDPNIVVKLNANQVLSARIPATQERYRKEMKEKEGEESIAFWLACYKETVKDLKELEVPDDQHEPWLSPLVEPILDDLFLKNGWDSCERQKRPPLLQTTQDQRKSVGMYLTEIGLETYPWEIEYINSKWKRV